MRPRLLWTLLAVALGVAAAYAWRHEKGRSPATGTSAAVTPRPGPPVRIEDQKTIDFSSGKPVVKDFAQDKAVIDAAVKEMDAATKDITFAPTSPAPVAPAANPPPAPEKKQP